MIRAVQSVLLIFVLSGCVQSAKEIGRNPYLSKVGDGLVGEAFSEPPEVTHAKPISASFSTWDNQRGDLFSDKLALNVGDILTIQVSINDQARFSNQSGSKRTVGRGLDLSGTFDVAGVGSNASGGANVNSSSTFNGDGKTLRSESISLSVAAVVTNVLGNGNLIVRGSQEVRVNSELRVLTIAGIVRPNDIGANNTISYERIAEARVSYGGRGHISHVQRPPYGQQLLNRILPF